MRNFTDIKRMVIKLGTNVLSKGEGIDRDYIRVMAEQTAFAMHRGIQVIIVTSGAIGMGAREIGLTGKVVEIPMRQACAAIGQPVLMEAYRDAFGRHGIPVGQVLLTGEVLSARESYLNLRNAIETLVNLGAVPVINENDCVSTSEIGNAFGDNDRLSAFIASKIDAELLVLLTDIDALYERNPREYPDAKPIPTVHEITREIEDSAGTAGSTFSTGGMRTKILAARIAGKAGCRVIIAHGRHGNVIPEILDGKEIGTLFLPAGKLSNRTRWILNSLPRGTIRVDAGAEKALGGRKSLLPTGITGTDGVFKAGEVVWINRRFKAVTLFSSDEIHQLLGVHSTKIGEVLGEGRPDVVAKAEDIVAVE